MTKYVYCSECGTPLELSRKAIPQFSTKIVDIVPPHQCSEQAKTLAELGIIPDPTPTYTSGKFVQNLDGLNKPAVDLERTLMDRRPREQVKESIAPSTVLEQFKKKGDLGDDPRGV